MKLCAFLLLLSAFSFQLSADAYADTVRGRDGRELKGIVVEDYNDRVVISTIDGEMTVKKSDIRDIAYDSEEDNLIKLAERARDNRDYSRAYALYEMAAKKNPDSKAAKDGIVFLQGYLFRKEQVRKEDDIARQQDIERYGSAIPTDRSDGEEVRAAAERLKKDIGIVLDVEDGQPTVEAIRTNSAAYEAGIRKGDAVVAVWSRLTGYMPLEDIVALLTEKPSLEIKCDIKRTVTVSLKPGLRIFGGTSALIGAAFRMEFDGMTVSAVNNGGPAARAGIEEGDLITAIDGRPTRYMPLKEAIRYIRKTPNDFVKLTIKREVIIWRRS